MRTAVITGASCGIGYNLAKNLLSFKDEKWKVYGISRTPGSLTKEFPGGYTHIKADLTLIQDLKIAVDSIRNKCDSIDLLVNNAGAISENESMDKVDVVSLQNGFSIHSIAPLVLTKELRDVLIKGKAVVVNIGSIYGNIADTDVVAYALSKSTVPLLTKMLSKSLAPLVRVNCILPGHVKTVMTNNAPKEFLDYVISNTPMKRISECEEITKVVLFLLSSGASYITGSTFTVDGGYDAAR